MGRFTQVDPLLYYISDNQALKDNFGRELNEILSNPQIFNAYAYALNNPIRYIDPDGNSSEDPYANYKEAVGKLADWLADKIDSYLENQQKQLQETQDHFASQFDSLSDEQKDFYGSADQYGESMGMLQESMYAVMGMMGGKGSNGKSFGNLDDVFAKAAKHAKERGHYIGKSVDEIAEIARNTFDNFDIKAVIKGVKKYFYNIKTNDLFVNNPKQPSVFKPKSVLKYLRDAISEDLSKLRSKK